MFLFPMIISLMHCTATTDKNVSTEPPTDAVEGQTLVPGVNELTLEQEVEGEVVERSFLVHLPDNYDGTAHTPLLFAFHGNGGRPDEFVGQFGPPVQGGEFIGVYPAGIAASWNIGREESKADDVAFTDMMLQSLEGTPGIDTSRPVGFGFSNGAALVHKIALESELLVAIVPQASQLLEDNQPQASSAKVSVMQFMGTVDDSCPYDGGEGVFGYNFMPAEESTAAWAAHNGCDDTATQTQVDEHVKMEWKNCANNRRVIHYRLNDIGHGVPDHIDGGTNARIIEFLLEARQ